MSLLVGKVRRVLVAHLTVTFTLCAGNNSVRATLCTQWGIELQLGRYVSCRTVVVVASVTAFCYVAYRITIFEPFYCRNDNAYVRVLSA